MQAHEGGYYIRLSVYDRTGAFAAIAAAWRTRASPSRASSSAVRGAELPGFNRRDEGAPAIVVMITHQTTEAAIRKALWPPSSATVMSIRKPQMIRIEKL